MAQVFLPCESQQWLEDKKYFSLLSKIHTAEEFERYVNENSESADEKVVNTAQRLCFLRGLAVFISRIATYEEKQVFFKRTFPFICRSASCLDVLIPEQGVPFLRQQEGASVILGRKLILSLIANAFLCTFPHEHPLGKKAKPFSFYKFFKLFISGDKTRMTPQVAKMRCFLNYFNRMSYREEDGVPGTIICSRQAIAKDEMPSLLDWIACDYPLCNVAIDNDKKIEDAGSRTLQVDFAAAHIGGGVLRGGAVQEEIRFCICPELLVSILITDTMEDNEAILMTGHERFSYYDGYSATFKFTGDCEDPSEKDVYGNLNTALTAIDAVPYSGSDGKEQYKEDNFLRDLNKSFVGFMCRDDRGDISLNNIPMRQGEYDPEEDGDSSFYETTSMMTDDDNEFDEFCVSLSSDIINDILRGTNDEEDDDKDDGLRLVATSLVETVMADVLNKQRVEQEHPTINAFAADIVDSVLSSVKQRFVDQPNTAISHTQKHSSSDNQDQSRSSGQLIDLANALVDEAIAKGIENVINQSLTIPVLQVNIEDTEKDQTPPPSEDPKDYAEKLANNILGSILPSAKIKSVVGLSSAGGGGVLKKPIAAHRGKVPKSKPHSRQHSGGSRRSQPRGDSLNATDGVDLMDPRTLNPPSSRMSIAWSTTSTRGEDSLPTSPTELDNLAINMVSNVNDLSTVMADLIIRDAIQACALPQDIADHLSIVQCEEVSTSSKGMSKIDTFLQSLHQADSRPSLDLSMRGGLVPFSSPLHNIRKEILRPVATGNWGCGAFKGDPQLKSMLQWMAVSASGRPGMKYYPFNEKRVEQLDKVVEKFCSSNTTVGQLCQLVSQYCMKRTDKRHHNKEDLFAYLLTN